MEKNWWQNVALILAAVGAINWGLAELQFNIVELILGSWPMVETIVYYLIGLSGVYALIKLLK